MMMDATKTVTAQVFSLFGTPGPILVVLVLSLLWYIHHKRWSKYWHLPGPTPLPLIGNLLEFAALEIDVLRTGCKIIQRFNGFANIWIGLDPLVLISNPDHMQIFYTNTTMLDKSDQYENFEPIMGNNSVFTANGDMWKKVRKMMVMAFNPTPTETFLKNFLVTQKDLMKSFHKNADGTTFRCKMIVRTMSTNSIFLSSCNFQLSESEANETLTAADYLQHMCYIRQFTLHLRFDWLFYLLPSGRKFQKNLIHVKKVLSDVVESKRVEMQRMVDNGEPIPNLYIYNTFKKFPNEPMDLINSLFLNLMIGGLDTMSNTVGFTLIMLGLFPDIQEKVYKEDQEIMKSLAGNELQVADLEKYEFLQRVIDETLRLCPVGPILARKLGEDTYFGDYLVPKGTNVAAINVVTYRRPDVFPDPLKFDPDRFLPENVAKRHPYAYNPFSAGLRVCPGVRYAGIGLKAIISAIVREFVIKSHYRSLEEALSYAQAEATLTDRQDFPIRILPRTRSVS